MMARLLACCALAAAAQASDRSPENAEIGTSSDAALSPDAHSSATETTPGSEPTSLPDEASEAATASEPAFSMQSEEESWIRDVILDPTKISTQFEMAYAFWSPRGVRNDRASMRAEYSKYFLAHFYAHLDAKILAFGPGDHRTRGTTLWLNDEPSSAEISFAALVNEAYLQTTLGPWSLKAGIQAPAWGEFEFIAVTDVICPQDYREPLVVSLDELRMGQPMLILDQYSVLGNLSAFLIPYPLFNEHPMRGTEYDFDPFGGRFQVSGWKRDYQEMEFGLHWKRSFDKSDVSLVAARLLENEPYYRMLATGTLKKNVQPYFLAGASVNRAVSKVLLKAEVAAKLDRAFMRSDLEKAERRVIDGALGLTYNWDASTSLTVETSQSRILEWSSQLQGVPRASTTLAGMLRRQFLNDNLSLTWVSMATFPYTTYFHTFNASYLWSDQITVSGEVVWPAPDDERSPIWGLRTQKQFAFRVQHQF